MTRDTVISLLRAELLFFIGSQRITYESNATVERNE